MSDMVKICGLWKGESKDGGTYYSGPSGQVRYLVFRNKHKTEPKHPDLILCVAAMDKKKEASQTTQESHGDDIPF